jgi:hypothetical protein
MSNPPAVEAALVIDSQDLHLLTILQKRLEEEDGPTAVDDLEAHAADRGSFFPDPSLPTQPLVSNQKFANHKRKLKRKLAYQEEGRQTNIKKIREYVQLSQEPAQVDGFDAKNLPSALGAYSSLRLGERRKKSPEIENLLMEGFRYIPAQDLGDGIKWVYFFLSASNRLLILPVHRGQLSIPRTVSLRFMRDGPLMTNFSSPVPAFSLSFKPNEIQTSLTRRNCITPAATLPPLISEYLKGMESRKERGSRRETMPN